MGDEAGDQNGGALMSDPVDVIIDKLLRYVMLLRPITALGVSQLLPFKAEHFTAKGCCSSRSTYCRDGGFALGLMVTGVYSRSLVSFAVCEEHDRESR